MRGKAVVEVDVGYLKELLSGYNSVVVDLGTGDGKFVYRMAQAHCDVFYVGVDSLAENLREHSVKISKQRAGEGHSNALYVIGSAEDLPEELAGVATAININLPWGSLLRGLVRADERLLRSIGRIAAFGARLEILINYSVFSEPIPVDMADLPELTAGYLANELAPKYARLGISIEETRMLGKEELRQVPSTWAKRLAFGRTAQTLRILATVTKDS